MDVVPARLAIPIPADRPRSYALDDFVRLGLERNPRLAQAGFAVEVARGRAVQAGLYPNPTISAIFDELGDVQGRGGINTIPLISQEIVTGGKLDLSRAAAGARSIRRRSPWPPVEPSCSPTFGPRTSTWSRCAVAPSCFASCAT